MKKMKHQSGTGLPEDLILAEILPRLHAKPLFRFKCVSKLFNSVISDPNFERSYMQTAYSSPESSSSSGLLSTFLCPFSDLDPTGVADTTESINVSTISLPYSYRHQILGSSNGLILSGLIPDTDNHRWILLGLCVSNPFTKQSVLLPDSPLKDTLSGYGTITLGIATRRSRRDSQLTYKVVIICCCDTYVSPQERPRFHVEIFSSDTGRWASRRVDCPARICNSYNVRPRSASRSGFDYRGILHWFDGNAGIVITYDPFDTPNRFDCIPLPSSGRQLRRGEVDRSLIYSGDQEMVKYWEVDKGGLLWLWRLADDSSESESWCLEGKFRVPCSLHDCELLPDLPSFLTDCNHILVAPHRWSRDASCHLSVIDDNGFTVINPRAGTRKCVKIGLKVKVYSQKHPLVHVEMCPWSSPFYAQSRI